MRAVQQLPRDTQEPGPDERRVIVHSRPTTIMKSIRFVAPTADESTLGWLVWRKRAAENLSMQDVKKATGVSVPTLGRLEKNNRCDLLTFVAVCQWLDISLEMGAIALKLMREKP